MNPKKITPFVLVLVICILSSSHFSYSVNTTESEELSSVDNVENKDESCIDSHFKSKILKNMPVVPEFKKFLNFLDRNIVSDDSVDNAEFCEALIDRLLDKNEYKVSTLRSYLYLLSKKVDVPNETALFFKKIAVASQRIEKKENKYKKRKKEDDVLNNNSFNEIDILDLQNHKYRKTEDDSLCLSKDKQDDQEKFNDSEFILENPNPSCQKMKIDYLLNPVSCNENDEDLDYSDGFPFAIKDMEGNEASYKDNKLFNKSELSVLEAIDMTFINTPFGLSKDIYEGKVKQISILSQLTVKTTEVVLYDLRKKDFFNEETQKLFSILANAASRLSNKEAYFRSLSDGEEDFLAEVQKNVPNLSSNILKKKNKEECLKLGLELQSNLNSNDKGKKYSLSLICNKLLKIEKKFEQQNDDRYPFVNLLRKVTARVAHQLKRNKDYSANIN